MRHATDDDLDRLNDLLAEFRVIDPLRERKRGNFQLRSQAFLHFHEDHGDLYANVRLDGQSFERRRVTTAAEKTALIASVRAAIAR